MSTEENTVVSNIYTWDRIINIIQSGDKSAKKKAFFQIKNSVKTASDFELKELYDKVGNILRISFQDKTELFREEAIQITYEFIKRLDADKSHLPLIIPAISSRVCQIEEYEHSEEIRYIYVRFLALLIEKYERDLAPYTGDIVEILSKLLADDAPHVKKASCACLIKLANTTPYEFFQNTKKCVQPLTNNLSHQHWRVRVAAIEALEWAMLKGDNKYVSEVVNPLSRTMFDISPFVRMATSRLTGHWLHDLVDRYSFFSNLVPLILTSLTDECEDIVKEAKILWAKAGHQYVCENEIYYKDRMDYEPNLLEHYPAGVVRPELGCRILVGKELHKFILALGKELCDWVAEVKIKASQLLSQLTLHAEQNLTMQLDKIIVPMCKAAMDNELPIVVSNVRLAAYYMGFFVLPSIYCELIVDYMKEANQGERRVIASIISGTKRADLKEYLPKVSPILGCSTFKGKDQDALLEVISSIFKTCQEDSRDIGEEIFSALISVIGLAEVPSIGRKAQELLQEFVKLSGGNTRETYNEFCLPLLKLLKTALWTVHCHEQFIFYGLATNASEVIPSNLNDTMEIIREALSEKSDPEVKLKIYMAINEIIKDNETSLPTDDHKELFSKIMLSDVLPLHLKWYPGKTAESIRTISCTTLYLILTNFYIRFQLPEHIIPLLQGLIDDPAIKTRILGILCIITLCNNCNLHETETFANVVSNVLKRFDDADRKVRELSVKCLQKLYEAHLQQPVNNYINGAILEFAYSVLLIHLDDSEKDFRETVYSCLDSISIIDPLGLRQKLLEQNFRDKEILGRLKTSVEQKLKSGTSSQKIFSSDNDGQTNDLVLNNSDVKEDKEKTFANDNELEEEKQSKEFNVILEDKIFKCLNVLDKKDVESINKPNNELNTEEKTDQSEQNIMVPTPEQLTNRSELVNTVNDLKQDKECAATNENGTEKILIK